MCSRLPDSRFVVVRIVAEENAVVENAMKYDFFVVKNTILCDNNSTAYLAESLHCSSSQKHLQGTAF